MDSPVLALIASFIAMVLVATSYFVKQKSLYLVFQSSGIVFLILSYFFIGQYFATIGLFIGFIRALVFFWYEKRNIQAPIWISFAVCCATLVSYYIINFCLLEKANPVDILMLIGTCCYAFIFRIRNLKTVRWLMLVPTVITIAYNSLVHAALFTCLSYIFELCANLVSIVRYHVLPLKKQKESTYEKR